MLVTDKIRQNVPFPNLIKKPTKLAIKMQDRIKYMFGITVEPVIVRCPGSYKKTGVFRHLWEMRTKCNHFCIASYEPAKALSLKSAWHVLDSPLFKTPRSRVTTKFIF